MKPTIAQRLAATLRTDDKNACLDAELGLLDARAVVADLKIAHALVRAENMLWQFSALA